MAGDRCNDRGPVFAGKIIVSENRKAVPIYGERLFRMKTVL